MKRGNLFLSSPDIKNIGLATLEISNQLKEAREALKDAETKLKIKTRDAERQRKRRSEEKTLRLHLASESVENAKKLKSFIHEKAVRPPLEDMYPELHYTIVSIARMEAGPDHRRWTDILNACLTLDDLHDRLLKEGILLSRQSTYLRLIPTRVDSLDGKKHVRTVPVKIRRARNDARKKHIDADFTFATKEHLKNIASLFCYCYLL